MSGKTKLFLLLSVSFFSMCTSGANQQVTYANGLTCQNYTDYRFFEWRGEEYNFYLREEGANCSYTCSDETVKQARISGTVSPLYSSSKEDLDAELCGAAAQPTPTAMESLLTAFPVPTPTSTAVASRTPRASATAAATLARQASPTGTLSVTLSAQGSLLTGAVSMCDLGGKLINFRISQPPEDISGRTLEVQIGEQKSICYVNPTNPSLLTCSLPIGVSFPARVVVHLDGGLVNDFIYSGLGCAVLTSPTPAPRPTNNDPGLTTYP